MSAHVSTLSPPVRASTVLPAAEHSGGLRVRRLSLDEWRRFVESQPDSTALHHFKWIELLVSQYGCKVVIPAVCDGKRIVTAVPLVETHQLFGGRKLVSLPFSDYVPLLWSLGCDAASADAADIKRTAAQALQRALRTEEFRRYQSIVVRTSEPLGEAPSASHWFRHLLRVDGTYQAILANYRSSMRRNMRHAEAAGLTFEARTDRDAMDVFYRLHVMTRQKLGVPVQPKRWFLRMHRMLIEQGLGFVGVVMDASNPAAAGVFLTYNQNIICKYSASNPNLLKQRPNELLLGGAIRWANERNYRLFDFGLSDKQQEGLTAFKRKCGAEESNVYHVFLAGEPRPMMQQWRARRLVSGIIRHSPSFVCRGIGRILYKFSQ